MNCKENKSFFVNKKTLQIVGILLAVFSAIILLWHGNATSYQATPAMMAQIYFDGEYRIADGEWQKIVKGNHISATDGDVTLRGNFHMLTPDGEYVGIYDGDLPIAFYANHINLTILEGENEPNSIDIENPIFGISSCGEDWSAYSFVGGSTDPIEILIHNPHIFGNETAIDEMLASTAIWANIDFEKDILKAGETQRNVGLLFVIVSLLFLGSALFSTLIRIKNIKILWVLGLVILFAGMYFMYDAYGVSFWSVSRVSNTTVLGASMIFYMLFLSIALVLFLKGTKKIGVATITALCVIDTLLFVLPIVSDILFYDTWLWWAVLQAIANIVLIYCNAKEFFTTKEKERWLYIGSLLPLISFFVDVVMTKKGVWTGGVASKYVFIVFFITATVAILKIIPNGINALAKAKELETERLVLNAKLTESRMSTMMSQIRPHFIYNTLGSIEQLCSLDPHKAGELVHNFAKYLRGNFRELDNPKPILMSQEMEHVRHYISIENVRFPDMTFSFEMNSGDFYIPALTIQPIVENAIKHGLMKLPKGGTIRVVSYETDIAYCVSVEDNGAGFDTTVLLDERKHVGLRNIRGRLAAMVNGTLEIESTLGVGTKVLITIPKEASK